MVPACFVYNCSWLQQCKSNVSACSGYGRWIYYDAHVTAFDRKISPKNRGKQWQLNFGSRKET